MWLKAQGTRALKSKSSGKTRGDVASEKGLLTRVNNIYHRLRLQKPVTAERLLYSALSAYERHDFEHAISALESGLNTYPDARFLMENYFRICCEREQIARVMKFINPAQKHLSDKFVEFLGPASGQQTTAERERHLVWLTDEAIDKNGSDPGALWRLADLLEQADQNRIAQKLYRGLARRRPVNPDDYFYGGLGEVRLGNFDSGFSILQTGLAAHPNAVQIKEILQHLCCIQLDFDRYIKLGLSTPRTEEAGEAISALTFYRNAFGMSPLEMFILKFKDVERKCSADELHVLIDEFLARLNETNVTFEKARQLVFFTKYLDINADFSEKLFSALSSLQWGEDGSRITYLLELVSTLTLPVSPHCSSDLKQVVKKFSADAQTVAQSARELTEPLADFGVDWAPWQGLFCLSQPRHYHRAMSAFETLAFKLWPKLDYTAPHILESRASHGGAHRKIRIGFTVLDSMPMMSGLMERLDRDVFETVFLRPGQPGLSKAAGDWVARADKTVEYSDRDAYSAIETIAAQELDILISGPSVPQLFFPLMARLAHLHMVLLEPNWPDGIRNSDYYISWRTAEPEHYQMFYKTPVSLLQHPPYWVESPAVEEKSAIAEDAGPKVRQRLLGLNPEDRFYICPNTPPKIHPQMDEIIYKILEGDPSAFLVLLRGDHASARPVKARLREKLGIYYERIIFLTTLKREDAHSLLLSADCYLDSYPICGMSSSFDGLMLGVPIVTLPADIPFGKWTSAIYEYIGVSGLTARNIDEYIRIAMRLANDKEWRLKKSTEILQKSSRYVENQASFDEFQHFVLQAWHRKQAGLRPVSWVDGDWRQ